MSELDRYQNRLDELRARAIEAERIVVGVVVFYAGSYLLPVDFDPRFPACRAIVESIRETGKAAFSELVSEILAANKIGGVCWPTFLAEVSGEVSHIPPSEAYLREVSTEAAELWSQYDALNDAVKQAEALLGGGPMSTQTAERPERKTQWTSAELLSFEFPPIVWVVPQLLTSGLTILVGAPKLGKSWLVLAIAFAVSEGGSVLSKIHVPCYDVLYLALEDPPRRLQTRLRKIGATASDRFHIATSWRPGADGIADLREWMTRHPETKLIVIDTWGRWAAVRDGNDYTEVTCAAAVLKEVADEFDIAIIAVHHTRKAGVQDFLEATLGSTGLAAAADSTMVLRRGRGNREATLSVTGRDIEECEYVLAFDAVTGTWGLQGTTADIQDSKARQEIVDLLADHDEPMTPKDIATALEKNHSTTKNLLVKMRDDGIVESLSGQYTLKDRRPRSPVDRDETVDRSRVYGSTESTGLQPEQGEVSGDAVREALRHAEARR